MWVSCDKWVFFHAYDQNIQSTTTPGFKKYCAVKVITIVELEYMMDFKKISAQKHHKLDWEALRHKNSDPDPALGHNNEGCKPSAILQ